MPTIWMILQMLYDYVSKLPFRHTRWQAVGLMCSLHNQSEVIGYAGYILRAGR